MLMMEPFFTRAPELQQQNHWPQEHGISERGIILPRTQEGCMEVTLIKQ